MGGRHSTEVAFALLTQPSRVRFLCQLVKNRIQSSSLLRTCRSKFVRCRRTRKRERLKKSSTWRNCEEERAEIRTQGCAVRRTQSSSVLYQLCSCHQNWIARVFIIQKNNPAGSHFSLCSLSKKFNLAFGENVSWLKVSAPFSIFIFLWLITPWVSDNSLWNNNKMLNCFFSLFSQKP